LDSLTQVILDNDNGSSRVTDAGVAHLTGLDNLISLNMYGTQITRKGLESIAQIESLKILNIGGTDVTGDLSELGPLENLEWLLAADLELSDDAVESLAALPKLSHLSIRNGTLSEEARAELAQKKPGLQID
jgi:hypothetical protein